uniref:RING-type domain-containing protein n=1 Tax=Panagrolaimus sp. JU765 TaxID=591449 RepID=A0AC34R6U2_9BILA
MYCEICLEEYGNGEFQQLTCGHTFCNTCLSLSGSTGLCPQLLCPAVRSMDIVVDEADDGFDPDLEDSEGEGLAEKHHSRISFSSRMPTVMRLEERQRCEARKGRFQCSNAARITLSGCKHAICFDCLGKRLGIVARFNDPATCPLPRCANRLTKSEIKKVSERSPDGLEPICTRILGQMKEEPVAVEKPPGKDEIRVFCSIFGNELSTKMLTISTVCTFGDLINAFMQVLKLDKTCVPSEIHIYVRTTTESGKTKFEQLNLKQMAKKTIKDSFIVDKAHVVFDLKNEIGKL